MEREPHRPPVDLAPRLSEIELVADIWAADAREAKHVAQRADAIACFARRRRCERAEEFGPRGGAGLDSRLLRREALADYSETLIPELALIRRCSEAEAENLLVESLLLVHHLPATWTELEAGRIDVRKMRALIDLLGPARREIAAQIEQRVLPAAPELTVPQLRARVRRLLAKLDAAALDKRHREARTRADVTLRRLPDGMSQVVIDLPLFQGAATVDAIDQYARMRRADGDTRPIGMIRSEVAADLVLRPWDTSRPPVTAQVTVHVPLDALDDTVENAPPAEIAGEFVTAAQCREVLDRLDMLGLRQAPAGGCVQVALEDASGRLVAVTTRTGLRRAAGRRRTRRRTSAEGTGSRTGESPCRDVDSATGPGLTTPPARSCYSPSRSQDRFVRVRDRRCRMPGCRRAAARCDIDHVVAHADGGATACWNLCCLCRRHHRIKTFAPGWSFELLADGRLVVRTPSGVTRMTRPPGWCHDPEPEPPELEEQAPPDPMRC